MANCIYSHYLKYICGKHLAFLDSCHDGLIWQVRNNDKHLTFVNNSSRHPRITQRLNIYLNQRQQRGLSWRPQRQSFKVL